MAINKQAVAEVQYAEFIMKRNGDEWVGTVEQKLEKETRTRTLTIQYAKGWGMDLTESIRVVRNTGGEVGTAVKKTHFGGMDWVDIEFNFGGWKYPIHIEVQKENERIDKSSPDMVKTDFGTQKIGNRTKIFDVIGTTVHELPSNLKLEPRDVKVHEVAPVHQHELLSIQAYGGTIFGPGQKDSIYATLSEKDNAISYIETTEGDIGLTKITVNLEKLYEKKSKAFESFSADILVYDGVKNSRLDVSEHLESERTNLLEFLSQKPAKDWEQELDTKTTKLK